MPKREHLLFSFSLPLHFPLLALHALLNGTDGSTLSITYRIAWLISVLLQVQRCQVGAVGLPCRPLETINPLAGVVLACVGSPGSQPRWANCCSQPFLRSACLFWFRVSTLNQQILIAVEE